jgi:ribosomal protein S12 methylthiotransferase
MVARSVESIVREVETLRESGVREVSLLAQDIGSYSHGGKRLPDLVESIVDTGIDWIRVFYVHPSSLTLDFARRLFEHPSVCRYLELPVQHASDRLLKRMGRRYTRKGLEATLAGVREEFPDVFVRSEVIVGFPGESEDDFDELKSFVEWARFASVGVFVYSRERGTSAARLSDAVPDEVASERVAEINDLQRSVAFGLLSDQVGRRHRILVDRAIENRGGTRGDSSYAGRHYGQAYEIDGEVYLKASRLAVGGFVEARVTEADAYDLTAELLGGQSP